MTKMIGEEATLKQGEITVTLARYEPVRPSIMTPTDVVVSVYWRDVEIGGWKSLPEAVKSAYRAISNCRADLLDMLKEATDRSTMLEDLETLAEYLGINKEDLLSGGAIQTRMHVGKDVAALFKHWDDVPAVHVDAKLSSINPGHRASDGIEFVIKVHDNYNTIKRRVPCPVWKLPNINKLIDEMVKRHFA